MSSPVSSLARWRRARSTTSIDRDGHTVNSCPDNASTFWSCYPARRQSLHSRPASDMRPSNSPFRALWPTKIPCRCGDRAKHCPTSGRPCHRRGDGQWDDLASRRRYAAYPCARRTHRFRVLSDRRRRRAHALSSVLLCPMQRPGISAGPLISGDASAGEGLRKIGDAPSEAFQSAIDRASCVGLRDLRTTPNSPINCRPRDLEQFAEVADRVFVGGVHLEQLAFLEVGQLGRIRTGPITFGHTRM